MVLTRSGGKRGSTATTTIRHNENTVNATSKKDDTKQRRAKRQKISSSTSTKAATTTADNKKARALQPIKPSNNNNSKNIKNAVPQKDTKASTKYAALAAFMANEGTNHHSKKTKSNHHGKNSTAKAKSNGETNAVDTVIAATAKPALADAPEEVPKRMTRSQVEKASGSDARNNDDATNNNNAGYNPNMSTDMEYKVHQHGRLPPQLPSPIDPVSKQLYPHQYSRPPNDVDRRDENDPLSVTAYVQDMYRHFRLREKQTSVRTNYLSAEDECESENEEDYDYIEQQQETTNQPYKKQPYITERMRSILVDWLMEVHYKFKLYPDTLYLTINILDRYLSTTPTSTLKNDLQLVGVTALFIASKYEEMYVPELRDFTYICDGAYSECQILDMEETILKVLEYNITVPTAHTFLIRFLKAGHANKQIVQLSCFLLDGTLLHLKDMTCQYLPSQLAAGVVLLARRTVGRHNWSPTLLAYSHYREEDVIPIAKAILHAKTLMIHDELFALQKKYSKAKYGKVTSTQIASLDEE